MCTHSVFRLKQTHALVVESAVCRLIAHVIFNLSNAERFSSLMVASEHCSSRLKTHFHHKGAKKTHTHKSKLF